MLSIPTHCFLFSSIKNKLLMLMLLMLIAAVYDGEKTKIPTKLYRHPVKVWTHLCEPGTHNTTCRFLLDVDIQINIDIIITFVVTTQNMSVVVSSSTTSLDLCKRC